jgi:hypothetical protein
MKDKRSGPEKAKILDEKAGKLYKKHRTPKPEPEKKKSRVKKKVVEDLYLHVDEVYLGKSKQDSSTFYRARVLDTSEKVVGVINGRMVQWGYGNPPERAIEDFIRKNPSEVIERIANEK